MKMATIKQFNCVLNTIKVFLKSIKFFLKNSKEVETIKNNKKVNNKGI